MNERNINSASQQMFLPLDNRGGGKSFHGDLFNELCSTQNIFLAWKKFSKGKKMKPDVQQFNFKVEDHLFQLQELLLSSVYNHGTYEAFTIFDPKQRNIHKTLVKDRLVHQALVNVIEPIFEKQFIFDSYSCRREKGTHAAVIRLRRFLRRASKNNTHTAYALKCDIRRFFDAVDHQILLRLIKLRVKDRGVLGLIEKIICSFEKSVDKGLPLGNLTSQLFANVYLHELDRFIKFTLREKLYLRYCDDFIVVHKSQQRLEEIVLAIEKFLQDDLLLQLHPHKVSITTWNRGIDFLGYVLFPHCAVLRNKTRKRLLQRVNRTNLPSYWGLCQHVDSYELRRDVVNKLFFD